MNGGGNSDDRGFTVKDKRVLFSDGDDNKAEESTKETNSAVQGSDEADNYIMEIIGLVSTPALVFLGKMQNPGTGKTEVNLEMASRHIEMLRALREKTRGNLSANTSSFLDNVIAQLQTAYLEELNRAGGVH